jgi:hypothetical protein
MATRCRILVTCATGKGGRQWALDHADTFR